MQQNPNTLLSLIRCLGQFDPRRAKIHSETLLNLYKLSRHDPGRSEPLPKGPKLGYNTGVVVANEEQKYQSIIDKISV